MSLTPDALPPRLRVGARPDGAPARHSAAGRPPAPRVVLEPPPAEGGPWRRRVTSADFDMGVYVGGAPAPSGAVRLQVFDEEHGPLVGHRRVRRRHGAPRLALFDRRRLLGRTGVGQ